MTLHPLQSNILVSVYEGRKTAMHIPDGTELQPYAVIMECGPECKLAKPKMKILCNPGNAIYADVVNGQRVMIFHESACFAEWRDEEKDVVPFS